MLAPLGLGPRLKPKPLEKPPPPPCWRWPNSPSKMSPISPASPPKSNCAPPGRNPPERAPRSEEHTSELQSLMRISYAVFCLKKKKRKQQNRRTETTVQQYNMPCTKDT